jgi:hypothetical protein
MRSFCLYPKPRAAERDPQGVGARPYCLHGSPEVCGDVDDRSIGNDELPKSLILVCGPGRVAWLFRMIFSGVMLVFRDLDPRFP